MISRYIGYVFISHSKDTGKIKALMIFPQPLDCTRCLNSSFLFFFFSVQTNHVSFALPVFSL